MSDTAPQVERIKQRYLGLLKHVESRVGVMASIELRADTGEPYDFDPMAQVAAELRSGGPANTVCFLKNKDFFVGIERNDPDGLRKFLDQLPAQSQVALDELDYVLTNLERSVADLEREHADGSTAA